VTNAANDDGGADGVGEDGAGHGDADALGGGDADCRTVAYKFLELAAESTYTAE